MNYHVSFSTKEKKTSVTKHGEFVTDKTQFTIMSATYIIRCVSEEKSTYLPKINLRS